MTALRAFLGLANYYSSYVKGYAEVAGPLMSMLQLNRQDGKKGSKKGLKWTETTKQAFEDLKARLARDLDVFHFKPDQPFVLRTDASMYAIGAVLEQEKQGKGYQWLSLA